MQRFCHIHLGFPSTFSALQLSHHPLPDLSVNHAPNTKRRHNPTYPRECALAPVHHHLADPALRSPHARLRPVIQIQTQQMQRRAHELDRRGCHKLRHARAAHVLGHLLAHLLLQLGRKQGRQVERSEDGEAVAYGEKGEGGKRNGAFGPRRAEELGEFVVFVEAQGEVGGRGEGEFLGAGGGRGEGGMCARGGDGVDCVGREVGAEIESLTTRVSLCLLALAFRK